MFIDTKKFLVEKSNNYLKIFFNFKTDDWDNLRKFIILKDSDRKAYQFNMKNDGINIPSIVLKKNYFFVSIYGIDVNTNRITTNELKINLVETGYTQDISRIDDEGKDIFIEMEELIHQISDVGRSGEYSDLLNIPTNFNPTPHTHNVSEINDFQDNISDVGISGEYSDLLNIPNEFNPTLHTHTTSEITDYPERTASEIKASYRQLANRIRTSSS